MKKYCFILDTGSSYELVNGQDDTFVVPIQIIETRKKGVINTYQDGIDFFRPMILDAFENGYDLSTAQPNIELVKDLIYDCLKTYEKVIFIPLSKEISGFYNTLKNIEKSEPNLIVVDSGNMGIGGNWIRDEIKNQINSNNLKIDSNSINEFVSKKRKKWCGALIVSNLSRLAKSGRISKFKALISNLLKLKILMQFDGKLSYHSKDMNIEVSVSKALKMIDDKINYSKNGINKITIMAEMVDDKINEKLVSFITKKLNIESYQVSLLPIPVKLFAGLNTFSIIIESN
ncbi:MAG: DegV family EDD domain-containing protein [Ureaplasma sp.]|nr:DegV family EDD domain-containing protein [Ureaplasma sp.]